MISRNPDDYVAISCPTERRGLSKHGRSLSIACSKLRGAARFEDEIPANMRHTPLLKSDLDFWRDEIDEHNAGEPDPARKIEVRDWQVSDGDPSRLPAPEPVQKEPTLGETLIAWQTAKDYAALRVQSERRDAFRRYPGIYALAELERGRR